MILPFETFLPLNHAKIENSNPTPNISKKENFTIQEE
tara:strand:+ start:207 stop:317 length:111 start_codon:yes stop_codon:yes gene_type:complete